MVSKEEYIKYVENMLNNDKNKKEMKFLTNGYKIASILMIIFGIIGAFLSFVAFLLTHGYVLIKVKVLLARLALCGVLIIIGLNRKHNHKETLNHYRNYREKLIEYLMQGYSYYFKRDGYIDSWKFEQSQFAKKTDCFYSSDVLAVDIPEEDGSKPRADIYIADIDAYDINIDEEGNRTTKDVYQGMFGYAKFPYKFKCVLAINTKYKKRGLKLEKVLLEDIEFNENFNVNSDNQIEARYILTPDMMEKLKYLQSKIDNIKFLIVDHYCFIGAEDLNMFELKKFKNNNEVAIFENLYDEIDIILKIVEEMKNNDKVFVTQKKIRKSNSKKNDNKEENFQE